MSTKESFSNLLRSINESFIRDNIYYVNNNLIGRAMKNLEPELQNKIYRNMPPARAEEVKKFLAETELSDESVESAQREILSMV